MGVPQCGWGIDTQRRKSSMDLWHFMFQTANLIDFDLLFYVIYTIIPPKFTTCTYFAISSNVIQSSNADKKCNLLCSPVTWRCLKCFPPSNAHVLYNPSKSGMFNSRQRPSRSSYP